MAGARNRAESLVRIARECFAEARKRWEAPNHPA
jgi:hypothetical protein